MTIALFLVILFLAASNGANDNFQRRGHAIWQPPRGLLDLAGMASITTLAGSLCSVLLARALLKAFTGTGLVPADIATQIPFALAVAGGAGIPERLDPTTLRHALLNVHERCAMV